MALFDEAPLHGLKGVDMRHWFVTNVALDTVSIVKG